MQPASKEAEKKTRLEDQKLVTSDLGLAECRMSPSRRPKRTLTSSEVVIGGQERRLREEKLKAEIQKIQEERAQEQKAKARAREILREGD